MRLGLVYIALMLATLCHAQQRKVSNDICAAQVIQPSDPCAYWLCLAENGEHERAYGMMVRGEIRGCKSSDIFYQRSRVLAQNGKIDAAIEAIEQLFENYPDDTRYAEELKRLFKLQEMRDMALPLEILLPEGLNSNHNRLPAWVQNGKLITLIPSEEESKAFFPFERSKLQGSGLFSNDTIWPEGLFPLIGFFEKQAFSFVGPGHMPDDTTLFYTAAASAPYQRSAKGGKMQIYKASFEALKGRAKPLPFCEKGGNDAFPVFHTSTSSLIFSSDRAGGKGGMDLWKVSYSDGAWGEPVTMNSKINSPGNELFPEIAGDTLYFSSDRSDMGFGGMDVYAYCFSKDSLWNLGSPINGPYNDFRIVFESDHQAYLTSNRPAVFAGDNIFKLKWSPKEEFFEALLGKFECAEEVAGQQVVLTDLKSFAKHTTVIEADGSFCFNNVKGQSDFEIQIVGIGPEACKKLQLFGSDGKLLKEVQSDGKGGFLFVLLGPIDYSLDKLQMEETGELSDVLAEMLKRAREKTASAAQEEIPVDDANTPRTIRDDVVSHENVYFTFDNAAVHGEEFLKLDRIVKALHDNPDLHLELSAHTDARGTKEYNMKLSERRALAVKRYLIERNIDESRIFAKAYGEENLLNHCHDGVACSNDDHAVNRRTELKVIENTGINAAL